MGRSSDRCGGDGGDGGGGGGADGDGGDGGALNRPSFGCVGVSEERTWPAVRKLARASIVANKAAGANGDSPGEHL